MFNKQTSVVKIFWDNENINKLLYGGGILCVILQYTNLYYFPCPDTNGTLIHNFPPYINEKILMKY